MSYKFSPWPHPPVNVQSQFRTKIQVGHRDKSWSNLGRLRIDQYFAM